MRIIGKQLTKVQVTALKRSMKRRGQKLPRVGRCKPIGGKYPQGTAATVICHRRKANKHVYVVTQDRRGWH